MDSKCRQLKQEGWCLVERMFSEAEVDAYLSHYMAMRQTSQPGDDWPYEPEASDPLRRYPRIIHPHKFDQKSLDFMIDPRIGEFFKSALGKEPFAVQTMIYFKPAGSRGQALHQDQTYLRVQPGTCYAAWLALDDCDEENGCLEIVPGTQDLPILCNIEADLTKSFTHDTVPLPPGSKPMPVKMKAGDVLFFNGSIIHGSGPNSSANRFRRSLIGHYADGDCAAIGDFYKEAWTFEGEQINLDISAHTTTCGEFVEENGNTLVKLREPVKSSIPKGPH